MNDVIATDSPLDPEQSATLGVLLDTLLPGDEDQTLPSAGTLDLVAHLQTADPDFLPLLPTILDGLPPGFAELDLDARVAQVQAFAGAAPEAFDGDGSIGLAIDSEEASQVFSSALFDADEGHQVTVGIDEDHPRGEALRGQRDWVKEQVLCGQWGSELVAPCLRLK